MAKSGGFVTDSDTIALLEGLVKIDSVNPSLVQGAAGEAESQITSRTFSGQPAWIQG